MAEEHALLAGRYRLVHQVGSGGMGVVWEARDERLERPVAVKQLRPQVGLSPEDAALAKNRAMREARITARLHHRNAVPVFDVVEHDGQPCLIMQFLPSVPLSAELREGGSLTVLDAARVGAQVASALAAAHALGIVHRDVKPGNILITDDGTALLSDFGISHALGDATLTSTGLVHGTPAYLAPEVARGASSSFASDVFSLGATLYTCLEGGPPFGTDPNSIALLYRVASGDFEPPRRAGALAPLLMEMLRADPDARPGMSEVADRLAAVEAGDHGSAAAEPDAAAAVPVLAPPVAAAADATGTTRVRRTDDPALSPEAPAPAPAPVDASPTLVAAPASLAAAAPAAAPPASVPPASPPSATEPPPHRRRTGRVLALVALLVGLVVLGTAVVTGQFRGGSPVAGPSSTGSARAATAKASATGSRTRSSKPSASPEPSESDTRSSSASTVASSSASSSTGSPSSSPSPTSTSGTPTAAELEDAVTAYYGLVPDDTDRAWDLLTSAYQRSPSGGRQSYDQFWSQVQSVKISNVDATPPERVDATLTYRRSGGTSVERTEFRLVRDDGVLKIAGSSLEGRG